MENVKMVMIPEARYLKMLETYDNAVTDLERLKAELRELKQEPENVKQGRLKRCPFCRSENVYFHETGALSSGSGDIEHKYFAVSCKCCGSQGGVVSCTYSPDYEELKRRLTEAEEKAIAKWNRREGVNNE